jgi:AraC-like DNA-binding protein
MDKPTRERWARRKPLASLCVFACGIFAEARGHFCERPDSPEGVLIFCAQGRGYLELAGQRREIGPGDLLYCPPGIHHRYGADSRQPWTIGWMHLYGPQLPFYEKLLGFSRSRPVRHVGHRPELLEEFRQLTETLQSGGDDRHLFVIQAQALHILGRIAAVPPSMATIPVQTQAIQKAMVLMEGALDRPFDLAVFARHAGYHPSYFTRLFRQVTGQAPVAWFNRQKMRRASSLLQLSEQRVQDIARQLGFTDAFYFSKAFKKIIGISPEAYRNQRREKT